jgi:hypothetical protein
VEKPDDWAKREASRAKKRIIRGGLMRVLLTIAAYALSLCIVAPVVFLIVIFLAGSHAGLLPEFLEAVILVAGWVSVLLVPIWVARKIWRRNS